MHRINAQLSIPFEKEDIHSFLMIYNMPYIDKKTIKI